ncbi:MAG: hypothetical protein HYZ44_04855 [Bacteroidetes bacterium]|nr:hypothetical protein [Bacteroidota bacterium]
MCRYIFSLLAISIAMQLHAQEVAKPRKPRIDTVSNKYMPTGLRIGIDALTLIRSKDNSFKGWEVNFDTDLYRYFVTVDYGYWATNQLLGNGRYTNSGNYIRFGADVNFLLKDPDKNMFFLGMRYGISSFSESVEYTNTASYSGFGTNSYSRSNGSLSGHWIEITTGLRVKIVSGFWMGCTARLKFAPVVNGFGQLSPYDMPGYGIVEEAPYWGFNYQLFWRFPFKNK